MATSKSTSPSERTPARSKSIPEITDTVHDYEAKVTRAHRSTLAGVNEDVQDEQTRAMLWVCGSR
jgi:hypothetical protein